ncbi:MAG: hypothetical protein LBI63_00160 [Candidatus Ancillula sp.]|jgi:hypothetical protein|nr:hypothetical protein [Candidatus Ancillula sp.]
MKKLKWFDKTKEENIVQMVLFVLCPFVGIYVASKKYSNLEKKPKFHAFAAVYTTIWLLFVVSTIYHSANQIPASDNQISTTENKQPQDTSTDKSEKIVTPKESPSSKTPQNAEETPKQQQPETSSIMNGITIKESENLPYERNEYEPNWSVGTGCDIRSRILSSTSLITVTFGTNGCTVKNGSWNDPYTGQVLTGNPYQGDGTANDLDIDHIIPLKYVNSHGGYYWGKDKKRLYGASLEGMKSNVYLAVSSSENRKKGDSGPSNYYPPNFSYRCEYSRKWRDVARTYEIPLSSADYNLVKNTLATCGDK